MNGHKLIEELKGRGYVSDITDESELIKALSSSITFYCGFDPTAASLHVGNLLPLMVMKKFLDAGNRGLALLGTGTGMIGDPSGKSEERVLVESQIINDNAKHLENQITKFFGGNENISIVKNADWLSHMSFIEVLRDIGKYFSVNQMIARDSVKSRLEEREQGISYTEFSYMILQAIDFLHLHRTYQCKLQIGGSDQWGNIASGIDLIRRKEQDSEVGNNKSFGLTIPLLLTSSGKKFGKTEAGTIWLSEDKTSPYSFYQFWLNSSDEDVKKLLLLFTDLSALEIDGLMEFHNAAPEKRLAQETLAKSVTKLIHGASKSEQAFRTSKVLFSNSDDELSARDLLPLVGEIPSTIITANELGKITIPEFLCKLNAAESKTAARKLIQNGGVSINNIKQLDPNQILNKNMFIEDKISLIKIGKKKYHIATIE